MPLVVRNHKTINNDSQVPCVRIWCDVFASGAAADDDDDDTFPGLCNFPVGAGSGAVCGGWCGATKFEHCSEGGLGGDNELPVI